MPNLTITNCDTGSVTVEFGSSQDGILVNAVAAESVFPAGTLLALHSADGKFYAYDPASVVGDIGVFVLTYDVTLAASASTGITALSAGKVNQRRLILHGGGAITPTHLAALRDFSIIPIDVDQLGAYDNS